VKRALGSLALASACWACQAAPAPATETIDPALSSYVLSAVPSDVPNRCFLDFGGKVAIVGYAIDPVGVVAPGSHVKLTLYWQAESQLAPGWSLFTHLVIPRQDHRLLDAAGPLRKSVPAAAGGQRQALGPSLWQPGKVYVDPLEFDLPKNVNAPEVTVVAGVWREALRVVGNGQPVDTKAVLPGLRLPVLSGPADNAQRGIVVHISTGVVTEPRPNEKAKP